MTFNEIWDCAALSAVLTAAQRTGLIEALQGGASDSDALAGRCGLDRRATERVLEVLVAFGIATASGPGFELSQAMRVWMANLPMGLGAGQKLWDHVETFLRTGEPFVKMDASPAERERSYRDVVSALGRMFAPTAAQLAAQLRLPEGPSTILDIGCGSGVWSLAVAARHPHATVTGLDLPQVLDSFAARAAQLGLADRVRRLAGDVHTVSIPARAFDLVLVANLLRLEPPDRAAEIVRRAAAAVRPGGSIVIVDALAHGTAERDRARAVYALHLALRTQTGQVHAPDQLRRWLNAAGIENVEEAVLDLSGGAVGALVGRP